MFRRLTLLFSFALALTLTAACNSTGPMEIPGLAAVPAQKAATSSLFAQHETGSIRLEKVVATIDRGHVIAHFPAGGGDLSKLGDFCNYKISDSSARLEWGGGRKILGNWSTEFGRIFFEVMRARGYNVVGNPGTLFERVEEVQSAEYLIGGRITDIRGNYCEKHSLWTGWPLGVIKGESYVRVEWEVYSSLARRVIYRTRTEGYARTKNFSKQGILLTIQNAFSDAVERVGAKEDLRQAVSLKARRPEQGAGFGKLALLGRKPLRGPVKDNLDTLVSAVVTIELGTGHGSGFLIGADGYVLTNAHVVGDGKRVPVLFDNGLRVSGEVLRVAKRRDVALVRIPVQSTYVLPIAREGKLERSDEVYVIGSPRFVELHSTVSKGIVSAFRKGEDGNSYIQSDTPISPGSSGGPMIDSHGNVVGMSVAGYDGQNLNLFIPIGEALAALNLEIEVE